MILNAELSEPTKTTAKEESGNRLELASRPNVLTLNLIFFRVPVIPLSVNRNRNYAWPHQDAVTVTAG